MEFKTLSNSVHPAGAPDAAELSKLLRHEAETDREVMEKGTRAFVSLVRGYKEHHCKFVFRIQVSSVQNSCCSCRALMLEPQSQHTCVGCSDCQAHA